MMKHHILEIAIVEGQCLVNRKTTYCLPYVGVKKQEICNTPEYRSSYSYINREEYYGCITKFQAQALLSCCYL